MMAQAQTLLFPDAATESGMADKTSSTFVDNMSLPVHRWFRFSVRFAAEWAKAVIRDVARDGAKRVVDRFAGSGTTLLAAEDVGVESAGVEAHPFVFRVAQAKLLRRSSADEYLKLAKVVRGRAAKAVSDAPEFPELIGKCYTPEALAKLHALRMAVEDTASDSAAWQLVWLTLAGILRITSCVGTAQWQYVLPKKEKKKTLDPFDAFDTMSRMIARDMKGAVKGQTLCFRVGKDARQDRSPNFGVRRETAGA